MFQLSASKAALSRLVYCVLGGHRIERHGRAGRRETVLASLGKRRSPTRTTSRFAPTERA